MSLLSTERKRKLKELRRSFSPPPQIQSFCFESEPMLDGTSPNLFAPLPVTNEANPGAYVNISNNYPKVEGPVSFTRGHCNSCPHATTRSQLSISLGTVPAAGTNHSIATYPTSWALNSMSTAKNERPEPTPYSFVLSSSLIRRMSRKLKKKRSSERSLIPKFLRLEPSAASNTPTPTAPLSAFMFSSSCQTQPTQPLLVINKTPVPLSGTDPAQAMPFQHAPQGTLGCCDSHREGIRATSSVILPSATPLFVDAQHSEIKAKSFGGPTWQPPPSQEALVRLDDTVQRGEPKLATGSAVLTEDPESKAIWALQEDRERAFPLKDLDRSPPSSPLSMEGSDFEPPMKSIKRLCKKRDCEDNVIATGDEIVPDATASSNQGGGTTFGTQTSTSVKEMDIHSSVPFSLTQQPSQSQLSQRSNFTATGQSPIIVSSTIAVNMATGYERNTSCSRIKPEQNSPRAGHISHSTIDIGDGGAVGRGPGRGRTSSVLMGSSLKSTLAKWKWKRGRGMSDSEADSRVRQSAESAPEIGFVPAVASGVGGLTGHSDSETAKPEILHTAASAAVAVEAMDLREIPQDISGEAVPLEPPQGNIAMKNPFDTCSSPSGMNIVDSRRVNMGEDVHPKTKAKFTIGGDVDESVVEFPFRGDDLDKDEGFVALAQHPPPPPVLRDSLVSESTPLGRRRLTLANAVKDEGISDVRLVRELERMREEGEEEWDIEKVILEGWGDVNANAEGIASEEEQEKIQDGSDANRPIALTDSPSEGPGILGARNSEPKSRINQNGTLHSRSLSTPSHSWLAAQRALLTCRELILTERHYLGLLSTLVNQETATPPPPLMRHYAAELLRTSQSVLNGMENEPTAKGVAKAFLDKEEEIEGAYVKWCEVVGDWFAGDNSGLDGTTGNGSGGRTSIDGAENWGRRLSLKRRNWVGKSDGDTNGNVPSNILDSEGDEVASSSLKRTVSTWRKSMPTLGFDAVSIYGGGVWRKDKEKEDEKSEDIAAPVKKSTVRELAILPTQRVMRYDLLYQDLLSFTPSTSVSRALIEQVARAATRIAQSCDRAQGNAAFNWSSPSPKHNGNSRSSSRRGSRRPSIAISSVPPVPPLNEAIAKQTGTGINSDITAASAPPTKTTFAPQMLPSLTHKGNGNTHSSSRRLSVSFMALGGTQPSMAFTAASESVQVVAGAPVASYV